MAKKPSEKNVSLRGESLPLMREVSRRDGGRETTPQSLAGIANDSSPDKGSRSASSE